MKINPYILAFALYQAVSKNPKKSKEIMENFYQYLLRKRKMKLLPLILEKLDEVERKEKGIKKVIVESPKPVKEKIKKEIKKAFLEKIDLKEIINKNLICGIILKFDDKIIDGSILGSLEKLREELWQTPSK